jgi:hypothetical protein
VLEKFAFHVGDELVAVAFSPNARVPTQIAVRSFRDR